MIRPFHTDPSWYQDYWYGAQPASRRLPRQIVGLAAWVMLVTGSGLGLGYLYL